MANKADQIYVARNKEEVDLNRFMMEEVPDEILSIIISFLSVKEALDPTRRSNFPKVHATVGIHVAIQLSQSSRRSRIPCGR
ncbi:F-box protein [Corchorus olitorius]|uniref:F-box protein n=1 Tax=Corchorus olitorius TaxID=93759 RepID=A0A1R3GMZ0_9ROSI|nr:F-box protein [Corchorus olitorius]